MRPSDLDIFYALLAELELRIGGQRRLGKCHGRLNWPTRGVYFFYEPGEFRNADPSRPRVVRVGTHALVAQSRTTLWKRLSQHRGTSKGLGNHRGSIFRLLAGEALLNKSNRNIESWGQGSSAPTDIRIAEREHETRVSEYLGDMSLIFLDIPDDPGRDSLRGTIERNSIALLSGYVEKSQDLPSASWLGHHSARERVRKSGLWNNNHVDEPYSSTFLLIFEKLVLRL